MSGDPEELLKLYLGEKAGTAVMDGTIGRGGSLKVVAAIMLADIRRSTPLIQDVGMDGYINVLNRMFDIVHPIVAQHGGEVLQFTGDGVLSVFPETPEAREAGITCPIAVAGAFNATLASDKAIRESGFPAQIGFGLSYGSVAYGSGGTTGRLAFTVISEEVNRADRLQSLCPISDSNIAMADNFALHVATGAEVRSLGRRALKGFNEETEVFVPAQAKP